MLTLSRPVLACFDNTDDGTDGAAVPAPSDPGSGSGSADVEKKFSQEDVNRFLASDKRVHQRQVESANKLAADAQALADAKAQEAAQAQRRAADLEEKIAQLTMTADQIAAKKIQDQIATANARAEKAEATSKDWEARYTKALIEQGITTEAVKRGGNPQVLTRLLGPSSRLVPVQDANGNVRHEVVFDLDDGTQVQTYGVAAGMEALTQKEEFKPLFKSSIVSGTGTNSGAGALASNARPADPREIASDMNRYLEVRKNHPEQIGLSRKSRYPR
jgi:hypothetical protein